MLATTPHSQQAAVTIAPTRARRLGLHWPDWQCPHEPVLHLATRDSPTTFGSGVPPPPRRRLAAAGETRQEGSFRGARFRPWRSLGEQGEGISLGCIRLLLWLYAQKVLLANYVH
jgi:hypothetical protein